MKLLLIPARGGSKGLPGKNVRPLLGKPLITYTIAAALNSGVEGKVVVSTDDGEIARVAQEAGAEVPFLRPAELARDDTPAAAVAVHALQAAEAYYGSCFDYVILLQPTSPLRTAADIAAAWELFQNSPGADSLVSVTPLEFNPIIIRKIEGGRVREVFPQSGGERRQDACFYRLNGAIYITTRNLLLKEGRILGREVVPYVMPFERSVDIDNIYDWKLCEILLRGEHLEEAGKDRC
ncbi:MAG: CMP-N,N-diacetyllegionaminic acid synthase [Eubacteriales bacterium]|nr:CMP-N,N-diacetyllegionaminic acid synthase [Eubacteriales bacterium]